jgi:hypothetical protein
MECLIVLTIFGVLGFTFLISKIVGIFLVDTSFSDPNSFTRSMIWQDDDYEDHEMDDIGDDLF